MLFMRFVASVQEELSLPSGIGCHPLPARAPLHPIEIRRTVFTIGKACPM